MIRNKILLVLVAILALAGCNKNDFIIYDDIPAVYYFASDNSIQIAPSNAIVEVPVGKGGNPKGKSSSSIELSTRVLILFNTANVEQYDLMPSDCYSLDVASITLDKAEKSGMFTVKIDSNALASLKSGNYAIPLRLKSDHNVRKGADTVVLTYKKR